MFRSLFEYLYHQNETGGIPMKGTGIVLGLLLIAMHVWALLRAESTQEFLRRFPRHYTWGVVLLTVDFLWAMMILSYMDMGEFFHLRKWFLILVPIGFILVITFVREFLSVRALGALMLLASGPVLAAAFLQPQMSRLLLPSLAYVWIIAGMYFVGMPFLMRDWIGWVTSGQNRWRLASVMGIFYGAVMIVVALVDW
jgi:hypothetical protein